MKQIIHGQSMSDAELKSVSEEHRLYWAAEMPHLQNLQFMSKDEANAMVDKIEARKSKVIYQCPEGNDITERVVSSCASGPALTVVVECMHNTWARYPCQIETNQ